MIKKYNYLKQKFVLVLLITLINLLVLVAALEIKMYFCTNNESVTIKVVLKEKSNLKK